MQKRIHNRIIEQIQTQVKNQTWHNLYSYTKAQVSNRVEQKIRIIASAKLRPIWEQGVFQMENQMWSNMIAQTAKLVRKKI